MQKLKCIHLLRNPAFSQSNADANEKSSMPRKDSSLIKPTHHPI